MYDLIHKWPFGWNFDQVTLKYVPKCSTRVCNWPEICSYLEFRSLDLRGRIGSLSTISPIWESIVSVRSQGRVILGKTCSNRVSLKKKTKWAEAGDGQSTLNFKNQEWIVTPLDDILGDIFLIGRLSNSDSDATVLWHETGWIRVSSSFTTTMY